MPVEHPKIDSNGHWQFKFINEFRMGAPISHALSFIPSKNTVNDWHDKMNCPYF